MINFDSLIFGDKLYIHAGFNEKTWARDAMLRLIRLRKLPIEMQPGLNPRLPGGSHARRLQRLHGLQRRRHTDRRLRVHQLGDRRP